jgi:hypothetical protein
MVPITVSLCCRQVNILTLTGDTMARITNQRLQNRLNAIVEAEGRPTDLYSRDENGHYVRGADGHLVPCAGALEIEHNSTYGNWDINEMSKYGGTTKLFNGGSAAELYSFMNGWLQGLAYSRK